MTGENQNNNQTDTETRPPAPVPKPALAMTDKGFEPKDMDQAWRFASALARSTIVPDKYRDKPDDCLIALDLALRLGAPWLAVMQHVYNVKGRPSMEAALKTALTNRSGIFIDPLEYEVEGDSADDTDYRVRAHAKRKSTGTVLYGPWITWKLVKAEGWFSKDGSKWKTMPEQMFHYRAASWFCNRHCPEVAMGMMTPEEAEEIPERKPVESMTYAEAEKQVQEHVEAEQGSEPVDVNFENDKPKEEAKAEKPKKKTKKKATKKDKAKSLYVCLTCKAKGRPCEFDVPTISGPKDREVKICPNTKCLSSDIVSTADGENNSEFMND